MLPELLASQSRSLTHSLLSTLSHSRASKHDGFRETTRGCIKEHARCSQLSKTLSPMFVGARGGRSELTSFQKEHEMCCGARPLQSVLTDQCMLFWRDAPIPKYREFLLPRAGSTESTVCIGNDAPVGIIGRFSSVFSTMLMSFFQTARRPINGLLCQVPEDARCCRLSKTCEEAWP